MFGIGTTELIVILVIVLIIFGVGKLPSIGTGIGEAIKNFKKATSESEGAQSEKEEKQELHSASKTEKTNKTG